MRMLVAVVALGGLILSGGDLTIAFQSKVKGPMGMGGEGVVTHYYATNFHKTVDEGTKTDSLVDFEKGVFYTIKHKERKIEKMTFEDLASAGEQMAKQMEGLGEMPAFLKGMMGGGEAEVKVQELGADTVAGRVCKKYKLSAGKIIQELSLDPSLKLPTQPAAVAKFAKIKAFMTPGPMAGNLRKLYEELAKLKGVALKTHMTGLLGMDSRQEATKISEGPLSANTFALPGDYKVEDVGKKMRGTGKE